MANFVEDIITSIDTTLQLHIGSTFQNITSGSSAFLTSLVTLYLIFVGLGVWTGKINISMSELLKRVLKIATALGFFLSWPLFNDFIVQFITTAPDALAAKATGSSSSTITGAMGNNFDSGMSFVGKVMASGGWGLQYLLGLVVLIAVLAQVVYALFLIVLSKIAVSLLLGLAPLFLVFLMFDSTKRMVETWIQQLINYSLVILLTIGVLSIMDSLVAFVISQAESSGNTDLGTVIAPTVVLLITTIILMQVTSISSAIAGGIHLSSLGAGSAVMNSSALMAKVSSSSVGNAIKKAVSRVQRGSGGTVSKA